MNPPRNIILQQDCMQAPWAIPDASVDMAVTSPPYWGQRDYGHPGQMGMERTPAEYVNKLVRVFREVRRILKPHGTVWLNLGDTYYAGKGKNGASWTTKRGNNRNAKGVNWATDGQTRPQDAPQVGLKKKDLVGIPWMVAFALRADGWYLRQQVVWNKPNPMTESVTDRCTRAHEDIFMLTKSGRYYYDAEAVKEPMAESSLRRLAQQNFAQQTGGPKDYIHGTNPNRSMRKALENLQAHFTGTRNKRSVWEVATKGYAGAHFATFPEELIVPCIKAGTSEKGNCPACGKPWRRVTEPVVVVPHDGQADTKYDERSTAGRLSKLKQAARDMGMEYTNQKRTVGWKATCQCRTTEAMVRPVVFDPFGGAATTALVAASLGRDWLLQELNPEYIQQAKDRLRAQLGIFCTF